MVERKPPAAEPDGFLGRWSRRKIDSRNGEPLAEPAVAPARRAEHGFAAPAANQDERLDAGRGRTEIGTAKPEAPPLPTLADVQALTAESDFSPFVARGVAPAVRNAAMKKLFTDPRFNVMDGLDVYIDDYTKTTPLTTAMIKRMDGAKFLGLFDDEGEAQAGTTKPEANAPQGSDQVQTFANPFDPSGPAKSLADSADLRDERIDDKNVGESDPSAAFDASQDQDQPNAAPPASSRNETYET